MNWLANSGIQNLQETAPDVYGGVNGWYEIPAQRYSFVYPEFGGYLLSLFSGSKRAGLSKNMKLATQWLAGHAQLVNGGIINRYEFPSGPPSKLAYTLDTSICATGLLRYYAIEKNEKAYEIANKALDFVCKNQRSDGSLNPIGLNPEGDTYPDHWSKRPGPYHAKAAIPLLESFQMCHNDKHREVAFRLLKWVISQQTPDGRFVTGGEGSTYTHAHLYTCEGLLHAGALLGNKVFTESAVLGIRWLADQVIKVGHIPRSFNKEGKYNSEETYDTVAQLLRLSLMASQQIGDGDYAADYCVRRLIDSQVINEDSKASGGFPYADGIKHVNAWVTIVSIDALNLVGTDRPNPIEIF